MNPKSLLVKGTPFHFEKLVSNRKSFALEIFSRVYEGWECGVHVGLTGHVIGNDSQIIAIVAQEARYGVLLWVQSLPDLSHVTRDMGFLISFIVNFCLAPTQFEFRITLTLNIPL